MSNKFGTDPSRQNKKKNAAVDPTLEMPAVPDNDNPGQDFELTAADVEQINAQLAEQEQPKPVESDPAMVSAMAAGSAQAVQEEQQKQAQQAQQAQQKQQPAAKPQPSKPSTAASQQSAQPTGPLKTPGRLTGFDEVLQQVADEKCRESINNIVSTAIKTVYECHEAEVAKSRWTVSIQVMGPDGKLSWADFEKKYRAGKGNIIEKEGETYAYDSDPNHKGYFPINEVMARFASRAKLAYTKVYEVGGKAVRDDSLGNDPRVQAAGQHKKEEFFASKGIAI